MGDLTTNCTTVFSVDEQLSAELNGGAQSSNHCDAQGHCFYYSFRSSTQETNALFLSHAVIYDVDLHENELGLIADSIQMLKEESQGKPLILVGEKDVLSSIERTPHLQALINQSLAKPVVREELDRAVDTARFDRGRFKLPGLTPRLKWLGLGSAAAMIVIGAFSVSLTNANHAPTRLQAESMFEKSPNLSGKVDVGSSIELKVDTLLEKANRAISEGRLIMPKSDNALHYFDEVLALDLYNNRAYKGRQSILSDLRAAVANSINAGEVENATSMLAVLEDAEPFSDNNRFLKNELEQARLAQNNLSVDNEIKESKETALELTQQWSHQQTDNTKVDDPIDDSSKHVQVVNADLVEMRNFSEASIATDSRLPNHNQIASIAEPSHIVENQKPKLIQPFSVLKRANPIYPRRAKNRKIEGWVEVAFQVDERGKPTNVSVIDAKPKGVFENASIRAIGRWEFVPAQDQTTGEPLVSDLQTTRFRFDLGSADL